MNMWAQLRLRNKVLLLFLLLSVIPLIGINAIWLRFSQDQLKEAAADRQDVLISSIAQRINSSLNSKVDGVVATSQDVDVTNLDIERSKIRLLQYSNQENEAMRISMVDREGNELVVVRDGALIPSQANVKTSDAFRVVTLVSNQPLLSDVKYENDRPFITVSVPLLSQSDVGDQDLDSTEALARRFGADIRGALIVDIDLTELWTLVLEAKLGNVGYMYLVDRDGRVLIHPNQSATAERLDLSWVQEVSEAKEVLRAFNLEGVASNYEVMPEISVSETNTSVLSSSYPIAKPVWSVIAQEPVSSVYNAVNQIAVVGLIMFAITVPIALILILFATRTIVTPIRQLTKGVARISSGDFAQPIVVKGRDEISVLAQSFNAMGSNLRTLLDRLRQQNVNLVAEQAKLQAVLDTITDGVVVLDQFYNIVLANKTMAQLGSAQDQSQLWGKPWLEIFTMYYEDAPFSNDLLKGDMDYFHDVMLRLGDEQKFIDITAVRILNDPNGIVFILTVQDTTPRRELENMKLDFVSMAAHELRTPLTAINGYLKLLGSGDANAKERESFVNLASSNASMLEGLINNMLSLSRIERDALVINRKKVNWTQLVREEVESFKFLAASRKIEVTVELPGEDLYVWGDDVALREVLGNLINNAIHYSDDSQQVMVKALQNGENIKTTVSDHGIGIPDRLHSKLFTKYYRAKGGLTTNSQGTGIGLFISKAIIDAHKGTINFDSTFGQGSDFYFTVEVYDENKHRQEGEPGDTIQTKTEEHSGHAEENIDS